MKTTHHIPAVHVLVHAQSTLVALSGAFRPRRVVLREHAVLSVRREHDEVHCHLLSLGLELGLRLGMHGPAQRLGLLPILARRLDVLSVPARRDDEPRRNRLAACLEAESVVCELS